MPHTLLALLEAPENEFTQGQWAVLAGVVTLALLGLILLSVLRAKKALEPSAFFKLFGLVFLVAAGSILIVGGYGKEQIAPMMALLGTAAGYVLGKDMKSGGGGA